MLAPSHPRRSTRPARRVGRRLVALAINLFLVGIAVALIGLGSFFLWVASLPTPDLTAFQSRAVPQSVKVFDRTGTTLLYEFSNQARRTLVPSQQISPLIKQAIIAIEDDQFYQHHGVRPLAILRAALANLFSFSLQQGGSTITQQVVKNTVLVHDKSFVRKLKEVVLAIKLEQRYTKDDILTFYLNEVPFGGTIYGVEEAAQTFFGIHAADVSLAQAAYLAALPRAPTYYSPYGPHRDALEERKNLVLRRMYELGFISQAQYEAAQKERVTFLPPTGTIRAPHFVFFVQQWLEQHLGTQMLNEGGLRVITTLDWELQQRLEPLVRDYARANEARNNASNAALVALQPGSGHILAMIGSRDYFDRTIDGAFNAAIARRQPGSAIKPFVYAAAFLRGYPAETMVFDVPTQFSTRCNPDELTREPPCYTPENYDHRFVGPISLRDALAQSRNVPAIKVLYLVGIDRALRFAHSLGLTSLDPTASRYGLTLVLGGGEVTLLDLVNGYATFAAGGMRSDPTPVLRVERTTGETLFAATPSTHRVIPASIAALVGDVLSDNAARAPAFGSSSPLAYPGRMVAVKTGTTNEYRDAWTVGYSSSIALGVWVGNNDNTPMEKKVASYLVAPLWRKAMDVALRRYPAEPLPPAPPPPSEVPPVLRGVWWGNESYYIDRISGKLATPLTPPETREERVVPSIHSILHWINPSNPLGPPPQDPTHDPQYQYWEAGVLRWKEQQHISENMFPPKPSEFDDVHTKDTQPRLTINSNTDTNTLHVTFTIHHTYPLRAISLLVNGKVVASRTLAPAAYAPPPRSTTTSTISLRVPFANLPPKPWRVEGEVVDVVFNRTRSVSQHLP